MRFPDRSLLQNTSCDNIMLPEQSSKSYPESMVGVIADKDMTEVKKEIDKLFEKVKDDRQRQHDFAYGH